MLWLNLGRKFSTCLAGVPENDGPSPRLGLVGVSMVNCDAHFSALEQGIPWPRAVEVTAWLCRKVSGQ